MNDGFEAAVMIIFVSSLILFMVLLEGIFVLVQRLIDKLNQRAETPLQGKPCRVSFRRGSFKRKLTFGRSPFCLWVDCGYWSFDYYRKAARVDQPDIINGETP